MDDNKKELISVNEVNTCFEIRCSVNSTYYLLSIAQKRSNSKIKEESKDTPQESSNEKLQQDTSNKTSKKGRRAESAKTRPRNSSAILKPRGYKCYKGGGFNGRFVSTK